MANQRPLDIWHISGDFPDPIEPSKPPVFQRLVELAGGQFTHRVISINRRAPGTRNVEMPFDFGTALISPAPPLGILHATMLDRLGNRIARMVHQLGKPDLIVGHKLTIEGLAVSRAAKQLQVPYALILQGNTDCKILRARPDLRGQFRRIYHQAGSVFHLAPWSRDAIERLLGPREHATHLLPCPLERDFLLEPKTGGDRFISAFHLDGYRNKNLLGISKAVAILAEHGSTPACSIVGSGSSAALRTCRSIAARTPGMELVGYRDFDELIQMMNSSIAMVLPSRMESFGLVFVEALMAGAPIIYPRRAGVSGYFDGAGFAIPVSPADPRDIANAMAHVASHEASIKSQLANWQDSHDAQRFKQAVISETFAAGLSEAAVSRS